MPKLFMLLIGCKPKGRHTEQHDVFFAVADTVSDLIPEIKAFWPEAKGKMHIDGWRAVTHVDGQAVSIVPRDSPLPDASSRLFFINLGGYKPNEFEEFHYKMLVASKTKSEAIKQSKQTVFFKHTGFAGAHSHIDDKYGVDVDDIYDIAEILSENTRNQFRILVEPLLDNINEDEMHLGYFPLSSFE